MVRLTENLQTKTVKTKKIISMTAEVNKPTGFQIDPNCDHRDMCLKFGYCWAYSLIKAQFNENASACQHDQAQEARQEVRNIFKNP